MCFSAVRGAHPSRRATDNAVSPSARSLSTSSSRAVSPASRQAPRARPSSASCLRHRSSGRRGGTRHDGVRVELEGDAEADGRSDLEFPSTDAETGRPVDDLQPYLAAAGHVVVMRADGTTFAHEHAEVTDASGRPVFALPGQTFGPELDVHAEFPTAGTYRLWAQFRLADGDVITAPASPWRSIPAPRGRLISASPTRSPAVRSPVAGTAPALGSLLRRRVIGVHERCSPLPLRRITRWPNLPVDVTPGRAAGTATAPTQHRPRPPCGAAAAGAPAAAVRSWSRLRAR